LRRSSLSYCFCNTKSKSFHCHFWQSYDSFYFEGGVSLHCPPLTLPFAGEQKSNDGGGTKGGGSTTSFLHSSRPCLLCPFCPSFLPGFLLTIHLPSCPFFTLSLHPLSPFLAFSFLAVPSFVFHAFCPLPLFCFRVIPSYPSLPFNF
jgi:hypothetical protein